jgi:hypothetical protein
VWFETKVSLNKEMTNEIWYLANLTNICAIIGYLMIGMGLTVSVVVGAFFFSKQIGFERSDSQNAILNRSLFDETANQEEEE